MLGLFSLYHASPIIHYRSTLSTPHCSARHVGAGSAFAAARIHRAVCSRLLRLLNTNDLPAAQKAQQSRAARLGDRRQARLRRDASAARRTGGKSSTKFVSRIERDLVTEEV